MSENVEKKNLNKEERRNRDIDNEQKAFRERMRTKGRNAQLHILSTAANIMREQNRKRGTEKEDDSTEGSKENKSDELTLD